MSLKTMAANGDGTVKKTDMFRIRYEAIRVEPGFNLRDLNEPDVQEHIRGIYLTIKNGGTVPPLLVRTTSDDEVFVVDGHCRHQAYGMAIADGCPIEYIDVLPTRANDADRVLTVITSSQGKGLKPLELAMGFKLLERFNMEIAQIAAGSGRTEESVKQLLILAYANTDVHQLVRSGAISAHYAIEIVRAHGDKAGAVIQAQLKTAKDQGKAKLTKSAVHGRALPKKIVTNLVSSVQTFTSRLDRDTRRTLASFENKTPEQLQGKKVEVDAAALMELIRVQSEVDADRAKQADKAKAKEAQSKQEKMDV